MKDSNDIKKRLAKLQENFNPEKNTYKILDYIINNKLSYKEMFSWLARIRGIEKYPANLKIEFLSIGKRLRELIEIEKSIEERKKRAEDTRQLQELVDSVAKINKKSDVSEDKSDDVKSLPINDNDSLNKKSSDFGSEDVSLVVSSDAVFDDKKNVDNSFDKKIFMFLLICVIFTFALSVVILFFY